MSRKILPQSAATSLNLFSNREPCTPPRSQYPRSVIIPETPEMDMPSTSETEIIGVVPIMPENSVKLSNNQNESLFTSRSPPDSPDLFSDDETSKSPTVTLPRTPDDQMPELQEADRATQIVSETPDIIFHSSPDGPLSVPPVLSPQQSHMKSIAREIEERLEYLSPVILVGNPTEYSSSSSIPEERREIKSYCLNSKHTDINEKSSPTASSFGYRIERSNQVSSSYQDYHMLESLISSTSSLSLKNQENHESRPLEVSRESSSISSPIVRQHKRGTKRLLDSPDSVDVIDKLSRTASNLSSSSSSWHEQRKNLGSTVNESCITPNEEFHSNDDERGSVDSQNSEDSIDSEDDQNSEDSEDSEDEQNVDDGEDSEDVEDYDGEDEYFWGHANYDNEDYDNEDVSNSSQRNESFLEEEMNDDDGEGNKRVPPRKRRHFAKPSEWKQNVRKTLLNSGKEYPRARKDAAGEERIVPARVLGESCDCSRKCSTEFTEEEREEQCKAFWRMGDWERQAFLLASLVTEHPKARCRTGGTSRRKYTLKWHMKKDGDVVQVCKPFFLKTFSISEKKVRTAVRKKRQSVTGAPSPDKRGRHAPPNKLTDADVDVIKAHITSLPLAPPHYVRKNSTRTYVEGNLNQTRAYQLYQAYATDHGRTPASSTLYIRYLKELNISFHQPRKDRCWCTDFNQWADEDREEQQTDYDLHIKRKTMAREEKNRDVMLARGDPTIVTCCFDMQAMLFAPMLYNKDIYYKRKLASYNLTVYNTGRKEGYCYMWDELQGKKGSIEVSSCLQRFILFEIPATVKTLNLYADNCPGQNKNSVLTAMLVHSLCCHPSLEIINLKFLEVGHTYQEADGVHSCINGASKNENIYKPEDWMRLVRQAKKDGKPYVVYEMNQNHFLDFKEYRSEIGLTGKQKFTDGSKLKWHDVRFIQLRKRAKRSIFIKTDYDEEFKELKLPEKFTASSIDRVYRDIFSISKDKYKDLLGLCDTQVIPRRYHDYYKSLPHSGTDDGDGNRSDGRGCMPGMTGRKN